MPRIARLTDSTQPTIYHLISRTALDGFPMGSVEKDYLVSLFKKFSKFYFTDVLGYCVMDNHFHLVVQMNPADNYEDEEVVARLRSYYGRDKKFYDDQIDFFREKLSNISMFMKDIKQTFANFYNKRKKRRGFFWGGRFKSVIVEKGETLVNLLAYVDLNPIRAGIVKRPEAYRWSSIGYHFQTQNKNNWLSTDFGFFDDKKGQKDLLIAYKSFIYELGVVGEKGKIPKYIYDKEKNKGFKPLATDYFAMKTRCFTESSIIGSKKFIEMNAVKFKNYFKSKNRKKPNPIGGLNFYSIKRVL